MIIVKKKRNNEEKINSHNPDISIVCIQQNEIILCVFFVLSSFFD